MGEQQSAIDALAEAVAAREIAALNDGVAAAAAAIPAADQVLYHCTGGMGDCFQIIIHFQRAYKMQNSCCV